MKKISIIIPCYNAGKTIERCAASLFGQTIGRDALELIFVNDASADDTYELLLAIEKRCPESVLVLNLEQNSGQGAARNVGMSYAGGEYIGFLDADDYVEPDMYGTLYQAAEKYHVTMAGGGYFIDHGAGEKKAVADSLPLDIPVQIDTPDKKKQLLLSGTAVTFAGRIYRRDFLAERNIFFLEGMLYEDNYWQSLVNTEIESYYISSRCFYHYVQSEDSSTRHITERNFLQSMQMQMMLLEEYADRGLLDSMYAELSAKFLKSHTVMNLLGMYLEWKEIPEQIYQKMREDIAASVGIPEENPYLWKADMGLLTEMFSEELTEEERRRCMEQYTHLLEQGRVQEWRPVFAARRQEREQKRQEQWKQYKEACFELAYHSEELQKNNTFLSQAEGLLRQAELLGDREGGTAYLEKMIARQGEYQKYLERMSPILVYTGDDICYSVLDEFSRQLIAELRAAGKQVEIYDIRKKGAEGLLELCGRTYQAIIGFQTYLFGVRFANGENVHDAIHGPKLHFIFDHPLWMKEHFEQGPKDYYVLTHGRDYQHFVERYFARQVKKCYLLPPAGIEDGGAVQLGERHLDVTFIGTWHDYRERLAFIRNTKTRERYLANRFLLVMKKNPNLCAEEAFARALEHYGITLNEEDFKNVLFDMKQVCFCIMSYYREKVIRVLLEAGIQIHVYGESWKNSPFADNPGLICHEEVNTAESIAVWRDSRISLNIMSWHKGGFTERIANMLLCGTVAVSDSSWYLTEHFKDGRDMVLFDLREPKKLAEQIKYLLVHEEKRKKIAAAGRKKALAEHTWKKRTAELLAVLADINENREF